MRVWLAQRPLVLQNKGVALLGKMFKRKNSKKGDKKKGTFGTSDQGEERATDELPQVWLPTPQEPRPDLDSELLPGGEEQQRFESFLVREEEEGRAGGWDEREELNYANIAANLGIQIDNGGDGAISLPTQQPSNSRPSIRRHEQVDEVFDFDEAILEERDGEIQHSQQPSYKSPALSAVQSETHSLFNYAQTTVYHVHFLGMLSNISNLWEEGELGGREGSNDPNNLLKLIEHSQRQGIMPWTHQKGSQRILVISKYGIKVTDTKRQRVYVRHTLHKIITVVHFIDTRGHSLLAVKLNHTNDEEEGRDEEESIGSFDLFVYECESENQATEVCVMLGQVFDSVLNKMKLEDNLGIPH